MKVHTAVFACALAAPMLIANRDAPDPEVAAEAEIAPMLEEFAIELIEPGNCRDTIQQVREERGLPFLRREGASPDMPIRFNAVDYEIDGCDVLHIGDGEVRPLPQVDPSGPLIRRAH